MFFLSRIELCATPDRAADPISVAMTTYSTSRLSPPRISVPGRRGVSRTDEGFLEAVEAVVVVCRLRRSLPYRVSGRPITVAEL